VGGFFFFFMGEGVLGWHGGEEAARHVCGFLTHCCFSCRFSQRNALFVATENNVMGISGILFFPITKKVRSTPIFARRNALKFFLEIY
jgi:hypothetical protein